MGIIQLQAVLLAVTVSFSLLYLQISAQAYSRQATRLLITQPAFIRMIGDFVFVLVVNSLLALMVSPQPVFFPALAGVFGILLFLYSLVRLADYMRAIAEFITPEAIARETLRTYTPGRLEREAVEQLLPVGAEDAQALEEIGRMEICVPTTGAAFQFGEKMELLIEMGSKMVVQANYTGLQRVLMAVVGDLGLQKWLSAAAGASRPNQRLSLARASRDLPAGAARQPESWQETLRSGARLAYLAGGLNQIWMMCVAKQDPLAAALILSAYNDLLKDQLLAPPLYQTDLLQRVVRDVLLVDTAQPGWQQMQPQVLALISQNLNLSSSEDLEAGREGMEDQALLQNPLPFIRLLYARLEEMTQRLLDQPNRSERAFQEVFSALDKTVLYGARVGEAYVSDFAVFASRSLSEITEISARQMAELVGQACKLGVRTAAGSANDDRRFEYLLEFGVRRYVSLHWRTLKDAGRDWQIGNVFIPFQDALKAIAIECLHRQNWKYFSQTLGTLVALENENQAYLFHAMACLRAILACSVQRSQGEAIRLSLDCLVELVKLLSAQDPQGIAEAKQALEIANKVQSQSKDKRLNEPIYMTQRRIDYLEKR